MRRQTTQTEEEETEEETPWANSMEEGEREEGNKER